MYLNDRLRTLPSSLIFDIDAKIEKNNQVKNKNMKACIIGLRLMVLVPNENLTDSPATPNKKNT